MFADRAVEQALISPTRPLLVIGAGAAGVSAAIRAAFLRVPTTLVEASHQAFSRQKLCATRWVDPTQYDWPVDHWGMGFYPWTPPPMPLPWNAQLSSAIATVWERELRRALARYSHLTFLPNTSVVSIALVPGGNTLSVSLSPHSGPSVYGAAVFCVGFGVERVSLGTYSSFAFWDSDPLEQRDMGLKTGKRPYRVFIGGGGDGALQDFLRITTGLRSAGELLKKFPPPVAELIASTIHSAEDQAQRAAIWALKWHGHAIFKRLHEVYRSQVQRLITNPATAPAIYNVLHGVLSHSQNLEVVLAYPCDHFSSCYGLNRLLTLLILEHARLTGLPISEGAGSSVFSVQGMHTPPCANRANDCHGEEHEVRLQPQPFCADDPTGSPDSPQVFDAVVLRLGVNPPPPFTGTYPLLITRQILPYHASQ